MRHQLHRAALRTALRALLPSALLLLPLEARAALPCTPTEAELNQHTTMEFRSELIEAAKRDGAPIALRRHPDGSTIAVVLVSKGTIEKYPSIKALLDRTMAFGMDITYNPASPDIDHGYLRNGSRVFVDYGGHGGRMDRDAEGRVIYGSRELNKTGLVHRDVKEYLSRRKETSAVMVELAFLATPHEIDVATAFHNLRRAGVVGNVMESAIRYEAGMDPARVNPEIAGRERTMVGMEYTENCVSYCLGTRLDAQIGFMKWKLGEFGFDVERLVSHEATRALNDRVLDIMVKADFKDPAALHPDMLNRRDLLDLIAPALQDKQLTDKQRVDVVSYLAGIFVSAGYRDIVRRQGSHDVVGVDSNPWDHRPRAFSPKYPELDSRNPRSVAVVVYSDHPQAEALMRAGEFEYKGRAHGIYRESPMGSRMEPVR